MRKKITILVLLCVSLYLVGCLDKGARKEINISVAASLVEPIKELAEEFEKDSDIKVNINSGGSGTLKSQISNGGDVGLFFSADEKYIDQLIEEGLILKENKISPLRNSLVLIKNNTLNEKGMEIRDLIKTSEKIAIGEVETVPAGEYARESLEKMRIWDIIKDKIIFCKDVTSVKTYVEGGEVGYGFIYKSDSINLKNSSVVLEIEEDYHKPIIYSLGIIEGYKDQENVNGFKDFIISNKGKEIFKKWGFRVEG